MVDSKKPQPAATNETNRRHRTSEKADEKAYGGAIGETDRHKRVPRDEADAASGIGKQRRSDY